MSPGMSMVGDMFNTELKAKLEALCSDIAAHLNSSQAPAVRALRRMRSATGRCRNARLAADWEDPARWGAERSSIRGLP